MGEWHMVMNHDPIPHVSLRLDDGYRTASAWPLPALDSHGYFPPVLAASRQHVLNWLV